MQRPSSRESRSWSTPALGAALAAFLALVPGHAAADPVLIQSPTPGESTGPTVTFEAVAPPGTDRFIFFVDSYRIAAFSGAGDHALTRALHVTGPRRFTARALDANGAVIDQQTVDFVNPGTASATPAPASSTGLVPPAARGAIATYKGYSGAVKLDARTVTMLANASQWLSTHGGCDPSRAGVPFVVQGSYHRGVAASAGTHDGGGVLDLHMIDLSHAERVALIHALREAGFAAWVRFPPAFPWHIHAVAIGDPDLSPSAAHQVHEYFADEDGLADHAKDAHGGPVVEAWMKPYE